MQVFAFYCLLHSASCIPHSASDTQVAGVNLYHTSWANSADDKIDSIFLIFPRIQVLTFHANCLHWKQFA